MKFYPPMYLAEEFLWVLSSHSSGSAKESEELAFEEASRARARARFVRSSGGQWENICSRLSQSVSPSVLSRPRNLCYRSGEVCV